VTDRGAGRGHKVGHEDKIEFSKKLKLKKKKKPPTDTENGPEKDSDLSNYRRTKPTGKDDMFLALPRRTPNEGFQSGADVLRAVVVTYHAAH
jgi:hypothetical protein